MTVDEAIRTRKSVRAFLDEPIGPDTLKGIMEQARLAPSARNLQEWRFILVTDPVKRTMLGEAANGQRFVGDAPVVIVACAETDKRLMSCGHPSYLLDVAIALDHLSLAAAAAGLGTCWIGAFDPAKVRGILGSCLLAIPQTPSCSQNSGLITRSSFGRTTGSRPATGGRGGRPAVDQSKSAAI